MAEGKKITKTGLLERIVGLVIPPAWRHVRISPFATGRVQAIGYDAAGRMQYIYHPQFAERQQRKKFGKVIEFGKSLPELRRRTNADMALDGFPRERVLAIIVRLVNDLYFRVGSEKSVKQYKTFGVTTLRNRHLKIFRGGRLSFNFIGKHHIRHRRLVVDDELASTLRELKSIGGSHLFNYLDGDGKTHAIGAREVNQYLKSLTDDKFSAKDFRTWGDSLLAAVELADVGVAEDAKKSKKNVVQAVKNVAERLGNTPAICRESYIHPKVLSKYEKGITLSDFRKKPERHIRRIQPEYEVEELALLKLLDD
jgi:DNA topoisomerase-1